VLIGGAVAVAVVVVLFGLLWLSFAKNLPEIIGENDPLIVGEWASESNADSRKVFKADGSYYSFSSLGATGNQGTWRMVSDGVVQIAYPAKFGGQEIVVYRVSFPTSNEMIIVYVEEGGWQGRWIRIR
jgi:hypothetical protein